MFECVESFDAQSLSNKYNLAFERATGGAARIMRSHSPVFFFQGRKVQTDDHNMVGYHQSSNIPISSCILAGIFKDAST